MSSVFASLFIAVHVEYECLFLYVMFQPIVPDYSIMHSECFNISLIIMFHIFFYTLNRMYTMTQSVAHIDHTYSYKMYLDSPSFSSHSHILHSSVTSIKM